MSFARLLAELHSASDQPYHSCKRKTLYSPLIYIRPFLGHKSAYCEKESRSVAYSSELITVTSEEISQYNKNFLFHQSQSFQREMVMKSGKHYRRKAKMRRFMLELVHDRAQSLVSRSHNLHELRNRNVWTGQFLSEGVNNYRALCTVKANKRGQKPTTKKFVGILDHSPLLPMQRAKIFFFYRTIAIL